MGKKIPFQAYLQTIKIEKCLSFGAMSFRKFYVHTLYILVNRVGVLKPPTHKYLFMKKIRFLYSYIVLLFYASEIVIVKLLTNNLSGCML